MVGRFSWLVRRQVSEAVAVGIQPVQVTVHVYCSRHIIGTGHNIAINIGLARQVGDELPGVGIGTNVVKNG